MLGESVKRYLM